jgi:hypothetical protein
LYAIKAFELEMKDCLLPAFSFERFYKDVLRLYEEHSVKRQPEDHDSSNFAKL